MRTYKIQIKSGPAALRGVLELEVIATQNEIVKVAQVLRRNDKIDVTVLQMEDGGAWVETVH